MGAYTEIVDFTFTANETSRTFSGLSITKDDFIRIEYTLISAANDMTVKIYPNGNTTDSNYTAQQLDGVNTTVAAFRLANLPRLTYIATSGVPSIGNAYIKLSENDRFNYFANDNRKADSGLSLHYYYGTSSGATFTSGITSLTFTATTTNGLATGSRIQIYRLDAEKVADITVASNTTQVDILNLSIDKDSEYLLVSDINNSSSNFSTYKLTPNDLTTNSQYFSQEINGNGSDGNAGRVNQNVLSGQSAGQRTMSHTHIKFSNIGAFIFLSYRIRNYGTSTPILQNSAVSSTYENLTSITKLNIKATATNAIGTGSRFILYKLYE